MLPISLFQPPEAAVGEGGLPESATNAAQSLRLRHLKFDFADQPATNAAQTNDLQHFKNDFSDAGSGDRAESYTVQHSAGQHAPSAPEAPKADAAECDALQYVTCRHRLRRAVPENG